MKRPEWLGIDITRRTFIRTSQKSDSCYSNVSVAYSYLHQGMMTKEKHSCITPQGRRIAQRAGQHFVTARVQHCYSKLKSLKTDLFFQKQQLEFTLSCQKLTALELYKDESQTRTSSQMKERHKRKFDNLLARQSHPQSRVSHRVINLSTKHLDASHISVLSRGLNFAPAPTRVPTAHFVTSIEAAI